MSKENIDSPWILFEAGALSKIVDKSHVCPLLIDIKPSDLSGPLTQFNATNFEKMDFVKLVKSINKANDDSSIDETIVERSFNACWPEMEQEIQKSINTKKLNEKSKSANSENEKQNDDQILPKMDTAIEEILSNTRNITQMLIGQSSALSSISKETVEKVLNATEDLKFKKNAFFDERNPIIADIAMSYRRLAMTAIENEETPKEVIRSIIAIGRPLTYITDRMGKSGVMEFKEIRHLMLRLERRDMDP